jgi:hypothetical protein
MHQIQDLRDFAIKVSYNELMDQTEYHLDAYMFDPERDKSKKDKFLWNPYKRTDSNPAQGKDDTI